MSVSIFSSSSHSEIYKVLIMEQILSLDGPSLASFTGMKDYIISGAEWSNSLAPLTKLSPSLILSSTSHFLHLFIPCASCWSVFKLSAELWDNLALFNLTYYSLGSVLYFRKVHN